MKEKITFSIELNSQLMIVDYYPHYIPRYLAHFEFKSPHTPPKQIPVSETGYQSHFIYRDQLEGVQNIEEFACELAKFIIAKDGKARLEEDDDKQMTLF